MSLEIEIYLLVTNSMGGISYRVSLEIETYLLVANSMGGVIILGEFRD